MEAFRHWARGEPFELPSHSTASTDVPIHVGLNTIGPSQEPGGSAHVASTDGSASSFQGAAAPTGNNATSRTLVSSGTEHHPSTGGPLVLQRNQSSPAIHSDLINDESRSSSVSIDLRVSTTPNRDIRDSDKHGDDGGGGRSEVSRSPRAQHTPSVASTPMIASTSPGSAATDALSSGSSDRGRSGAGKRRMLLDADVRCAEGREHYGGSVRLEYNDGDHEMEQPIDDNGRQQRHDYQRQQEQQQQQQQLQPASQTATILRGKDGRDVARPADVPRSSRRGVGGNGSSRSEQNERPSTPARIPGRKHRRVAPASTDDGFPGRAFPAGRSSSSARVSPTLDTVMEDHDRFDELSAADDAAFTSAVASIQQVADRQLDVREGFARCHARLLQQDVGLDNLAKADKLMEGARSLLEDMGLIDETKTAGEEPMEQGNEEENDRSEETCWNHEHDALEQPLPPPPTGVTPRPPSEAEMGTPDVIAEGGAEDAMDVAETQDVDIGDFDRT